MSCSVSKILDEQTQHSIDDGVDYISKQIKKNFYNTDKDCQDGKIDRFVAFTSIALQYIVFAFILVSLAKKEQSGTIVRVIAVTSFVTMILLVIQHRNILLSALRILGALDTSTKVILVLSVLATLGTGYIKKGGTGLYLTMGIAAVLFLRLSLQVKSFLTGASSPMSGFTMFLRETVTTSRIKTLYNAFKK